jgi:hypothetical protein
MPYEFVKKDYTTLKKFYRLMLIFIIICKTLFMFSNNEIQIVKLFILEIERKYTINIYVNSKVCKIK